MKMRIMILIEMMEAKKQFLLGMILLAFFGVLNMLLNFSKVLHIVDNSLLMAILGIFSNFVIAFLVHGFYVLALALLLYFCSAIVGEFFAIGVFIRLSISVFIFNFLVGIADFVGFITIGEKFSRRGFIGLVSYLPFYIMSLLLLNHHLKKLDTYSKKQLIVFNILGFFLIIAISYPW